MKNTKERGLRIKTMHALIERDIRRQSKDVKKGRMKNTKERGLRMKSMHALMERDIRRHWKK